MNPRLTLFVATAQSEGNSLGLDPLLPYSSTPL
jgi:hypothetical protein